MSKKSQLKFIVIIVLLVFAYFFKCKAGIDLFSSFSLTKFFFCKKIEATENIISIDQGCLLNDSFEYDTSGTNWTPLWMKEEGLVKQQYDDNGLNGSKCLLIESNSQKYWSYTHNRLIAVKAGDELNFSGFVRAEGSVVSTALSVILYNSDREVIDWHYAQEKVRETKSWIKIERRFIVPDNIAYIRFRLSGDNIGTIWFDNVEFYKEKSKLGTEIQKAAYIIENINIRYTLNIQGKKIIVLDKRIGKEWTANLPHNLIFSKVKEEDNSLFLEVMQTDFSQRYKIRIYLFDALSEVEYKIEKIDNEKFTILEFPPLFEVTQDMQYVVPLQEGILFPQGKFSPKDFPLFLQYSGGWSMPFLGVIAEKGGWMEIVETPSDFEIRKDETRIEQQLYLKNCWLAEKGTFGYTRKIKFIFFEKDGYIKIAKKYREYVALNGLLVKLKDKDELRGGNIDKLVGAVNVWYWGIDCVRICRNMFDLGIAKVFFSRLQNKQAKEIAAINEVGFLTSRYDIYQDVWDPKYDYLIDLHEGWPDDLVLDSKGNWVKGWSIKKGMDTFYGGVVCSKKGLERAKKKIPQEMKEKNYTGRFIDTTTSSLWRECYHPKHPVTRTEDIKYRMQLLEFCSKDMKLVTGSEDGVDCAVPYVDYFEGMMSIGIGRLPGSGRNVGSVQYIEPTENFNKYQLGEYYRVPLWELVYGDCIVSTWYWGDSSNLIPELWWKRDLFNILYGNMPLWAIRDWKHWKKYKKRFIESYNNVSPVFEKVGFKEMLEHKFLSKDRTVQETVFVDNIQIFVNFGKEEFLLEDKNYKLPPKGFVVFEDDKNWKQGVCS